MNLSRSWRKGFVLLLVGASLPAPSAILKGASGAYGVEAELNLATLTLDVGPAAEFVGTAPDPYIGSESLAWLDADESGLARMGTGLLLAEGRSDVDGWSGIRMASSRSRIDTPFVWMLPKLGETPFVAFYAVQVESTSTVMGEDGSLAAKGTTTLTKGSLTIGTHRFLLEASPDPNTVLFNQDGIEVILNEQVVTSIGSEQTAITTNAVHVRFRDVVTAQGVLSGEFIIGNSDAMLSTVPEPAGVLLFSFGALALLRSRRR